jgi:hypothetical protein
VTARPAGQAVRGFIVELLARASRLEQRRAAAEQRAVSTRCFMARGGDAMDHDGRWTLRWCEHSTGGQLDDGNLVNEDTRARSRGDWGKMAPIGGSRLSAMAVQ